MGYTTVANVAGMFPTFVRGTAQQKPADALIQTYIDDAAAEVNAVLVRRGFVATGLTAAQLGQTLATFGVLSAGTLSKTFADNYQRLKNDLDARDSQSRPLASGPYDKYFDPLARTETAQPALKAISGGDQPEGQTPADTGSSQVFGKFDKRGT